MVTIKYGPTFEKEFHKIKHELLKEKVKKQILRIIADPEIGKPMRFDRRGTHEVYIPPFRLSYAYEKDTIILLYLYYRK